MKSFCFLSHPHFLCVYNEIFNNIVYGFYSVKLKKQGRLQVMSKDAVEVPLGAPLTSSLHSARPHSSCFECSTELISCHGCLFFMSSKPDFLSLCTPNIIINTFGCLSGSRALDLIIKTVCSEASIPNQNRMELFTEFDKCLSGNYFLGGESLQQ